MVTGTGLSVCCLGLSTSFIHQPTPSTPTSHLTSVKISKLEDLKWRKEKLRAITSNDRNVKSSQHALADSHQPANKFELFSLQTSEIRSDLYFFTQLCSHIIGDCRVERIASNWSLFTLVFILQFSIPRGELPLTDHVCWPGPATGIAIICWPRCPGMRCYRPGLRFVSRLKCNTTSAGVIYIAL